MVQKFNQGDLKSADPDTLKTVWETYIDSNDSGGLSSKSDKKLFVKEMSKLSALYVMYRSDHKDTR